MRQSASLIQGAFGLNTQYVEKWVRSPRTAPPTRVWLARGTGRAGSAQARTPSAATVSFAAVLNSRPSGPKS